MRIRTFTGNSLAEAMAEVRAELGADAIILSSFERKRGGGAEVKAAIDRPEAETIGGRGEHAALARDLRLRLQREMASLNAGGNAQAPGDPPGAPLAREDLRELYAVLHHHGFTRGAMTRLLREARQVPARDLGEALAYALDTHYAFRPLTAEAKSPLFFVGPAGMGKTVSLAKAAARLALAGRRPLLLTTDTLRAGAAEQLAAYGQIIGLEVAVAETPQRLSALIGNAAGRPVLVDTPATNPLRQAELDDLAAFIKAIMGEPLLVLAAGSDPAEMAEPIERFQGLGTRRVLMTRVDAARRIGALVEAIGTAGLSLAEIGVSAYLADGFEPAGPESLARRLIDTTPAEARQAVHKKATPAPSPAPQRRSA